MQIDPLTPNAEWEINLIKWDGSWLNTETDFIHVKSEKRNDFCTRFNTVSDGLNHIRRRKARFRHFIRLSEATFDDKLNLVRSVSDGGWRL